MQTFLSRLNSKLDPFRGTNRPTLRACVVGGGVAGIEIAFCLQKKLLHELERFHLALFTAAEHLAPSCSRSTRRRIGKLMVKADIDVCSGKRVKSVSPDGEVLLEDKSGATESAGNFDVVLWATSAIGHPWLSKLGLSVDERGFLQTRPTLQSVDSDSIFVVGDSGTISDSPTPKAGVYAVRQGPFLWENLDRILSGKKLIPFQPQKQFLKLINTGDGKAIAEYAGWSLHSGWAWRLKDRIDRRFMAQYQ